MGATAGTYFTTQHVRRSPQATHYELMALFGLGGLGLSLLVNVPVLRTALRPLARLERTARRVEAGDLGARARPGAINDPDTDRLAATFNAMLDRLHERSRQIELYSARLRALADRVLLVQEEERERLAGRLLDDTGQSLATLLLHFRLFRDAAGQTGADAPALGRRASELAELTRQTLDSVRALAQEMSPRLLDDLGLVVAVQALAQEWQARTGMAIELDLSLPAEVPVPRSAGIAVYRMVQEALANVARHAQAARVRVTLGYDTGELVAEVADDGRGLARVGTSPPPSPAADGRRTGLGLFAMQERIGLVGGRFAVESTPDRGTTVRAVLPLPQGAEGPHLLDAAAVLESRLVR